MKKNHYFFSGKEETGKVTQKKDTAKINEGIGIPMPSKI